MTFLGKKKKEVEMLIEFLGRDQDATRLLKDNVWISVIFLL